MAANGIVTGVLLAFFLYLTVNPKLAHGGVAYLAAMLLLCVTVIYTCLLPALVAGLQTFDELVLLALPSAGLNLATFLCLFAAALPRVDEG